MKNESNLFKHTIIMTVVNLIMRSVSVSFNAYLTNKIGSAGIGIFQLVMSVYSLAVTFSSAGIKLASTRITAQINATGKYDMNKSLGLCLSYAGFMGSLIGFLLLVFSDFIGEHWIGNTETSFPLKILALSLPFVAVSSSLGGYFNATDKTPQFSFIQMLEQGFKAALTVYLLNKTSAMNMGYSVASIVAGMTAAEIFSFSLSLIYQKLTKEKKTNSPTVPLPKFLRITLPDAVGSCARSLFLTLEHLMIPKGFLKSGSDSETALSAYGCIHAMALPLLLYPCAIITSLATLLIPDIAKKYEIGDKDGIDSCVSRTIKRTAFYSIMCAICCYIFAPSLSNLVYKSDEAVMYIKILSPLVPIMYLDTVTDGLLKGLDKQIYSMRYNIIDSVLCVILVYFILPKYSVKGYIFILYASEIINFFLSFNKLISICNIRVFQAPSKDNSMFFRLKKCSVFRKEYGYQKYQGQKKRNQVL